MSQIIRPWQFYMWRYVKWQIEHKRAQIARDEALRAARRAKRLAAAAAAPAEGSPEAGDNA
jgi:hypothetical protein